MSTLTNKAQDSKTTRHLLLEDLLEEQSSMSAVDSFSYWHDQATFHNDVYRALVPATMPSPGEQYAFEVDLDTCSGCKACVVACHNLNDLEESETWRKVGIITGAVAELAVLQHVSTACHHCVEPGCLLGCPVKAYEKDDVTGIVKHLDDQCFGCKYCIMMCPYEVPQFSRKLGIVRKCDMCSQRISTGTGPACVQACPNAAIRITIVRQKDCSEASSSKGLIATGPDSFITLPTTKYVSQRQQLLVCNSVNSHALQSIESANDMVQEGHWPLVAMLTLSQASVGMWIAMCFGLRDNLTSIATSLTATLLGLIGIHAALFHLGRPMYAYRAFLGWRTSWLSREAIVFGLFLGSSLVACGTTVFQKLGTFSTGSYALIATLLTASIGAFGVYCSAMIYVATRRQLWSWNRTLWDMGFTTLGLGWIGYGATVSLSYGWMVLAWLVGTFACLPKGMDIIAAMKNSKLPTNNMSIRSGRMMQQQLLQPMSMLIALAIASLGAACIGWNGLAFVLSLILHGLHRWVYFASVVYRRMPGSAS